MNYQALIVCFLIAVKASKQDVPEVRGIVEGPLNDAVDIEDSPNVTLTCQASDPSPVSRVSWTEYITNPAGAAISDGDLVLPGHPNSERYDIEHDNSTQYDLSITPTLLEDGGAYRCVDVNDAATESYAQLIIIQGQPNCSTNIPDDGYVRELEYYTYECSLFYRGNVAPVMTWEGPGQYNELHTSTNTTVWSGIGMNMSRDNEAQTFGLLVNFTEDGFIQPNYASNVPTWYYNISTAPLVVEWGPKNIYYEPVQQTYDIGTELSCYADSKPPANFFWQNMDTNERWDSYKFTTTPGMVGTQVVRCHAQNIIGHGVFVDDIFFNLTVNAPTTTTPPTTTTTTTPPPAEAPCDDLTGRWHSTQPHVIDMCFEINNTDHGRMVGILRNDTQTYFTEIRGRIVPYKYNQIGFVGVFPGPIGAIGFTGTCNKCYGEEVLIVDAVKRRINDNPDCADHGNPEYSDYYSFQRVSTTCRGLVLDS